MLENIDSHYTDEKVALRKLNAPQTFRAASQFSSMIGMGAPRSTTLSTSSAANKQGKQ